MGLVFLPCAHSGKGGPGPLFHRMRLDVTFFIPRSSQPHALGMYVSQEPQETEGSQVKKGSWYWWLSQIESLSLAIQNENTTHQKPSLTLQLFPKFISPLLRWIQNPPPPGRGIRAVRQGFQKAH